jgi:predicted N-acetyltransferase YhbS
MSRCASTNSLVVLAVLATSGKYRRRGAGSLLVQWGIELSEKLGFPCILQATEEGRQLYKRRGFEDIETMQFDLAKYGLAEKGVSKLTEMIRYPSKTRKV